jgi:hypothetical protein
MSLSSEQRFFHQVNEDAQFVTQRVMMSAKP